MTAFRLLADIGGTNARFALQAPGDGCADIEVLACRDYEHVKDAIDAYLARAAARGHATDGIRHAAIAIANPVEGDMVSMTNHHWHFSIVALREACGLATLLVVNDFAALAQALPHLDARGRERIGGLDAAVVEERPLGLIGPGTGLGVSGVMPAGGGRWIALAGEGGHASFAPVTRTEMRLLDALWEEHGHVSAERLLSGPGLEAIHRVLAGERLAAADISARALDGSCAACRATVDAFCAILGSVAGNVALTLGATGGMYIGGGVVPRLGPLFHASAFRERFEGKGRLQPYLARIPTWLVTEPYPALRGVAALLDTATR
ncbi:glucokinase [Massilia sp. TW-1]|uniref:Glucokinase n=1 Tax=Telluria antibiotica TaxID=2717319 RepID=A0ABX0PAJ8_9BURK|nr:glucokinase [Telluria antibiotica]NIA54319.1 glucokinase [Telluria antibiotica]